MRCLDRTVFFLFLLASALAVAPASHAQQGMPPIARARANAQSFLNRMVQVAVAPTASAAVTGFGFIVGERVTAKGEPGFLIVTADHLVRSASNPPGPSMVQVRFYADADPIHHVQAEVLDEHLSPSEGDLAVLVAPKPSMRTLASVALGSSQALVPGMAAWQLGQADRWTTPEVTGRFTLRARTGWLYFDDFDGSAQSAGGAAITELGLAGMVVGNGSPTATARVLPVELISAKFKEWGLSWNLSGTPAPP